MNYELVKKLKDAGFPQTAKPNSDQTFSFENGGNGGSYYMVCPVKNGCCFIQFFTAQDYAKTIKSVPPEGFKASEILKIPTLSELIAWFQKYAEGGSVVSLILKYEWTVNTPQFPSFSALLTEAKGCGDDSTSWETKAEGTTPEEAVAKLCLVLNEKS